MTKQKYKDRVVPKSTISASEIKHFVNGAEVASLPEMLERLGFEVERSKSGHLYNVIHLARKKLLPEPIVYGTSYLYPVEVLEKVITEVQTKMGAKKEQSDKVKRLIEKLKSSPELAEVLLGLLD